jgi:hypothetical protein
LRSRSGPIVTFTVLTDNAFTSYRRSYSTGLSPPFVGQIVPVRTLTIGGYRRVELGDPAQGISGLICGGIFVVLWCGFFLLIAAITWLASNYQKSLLRDGSWATATVIDKTSVRGKNSVYQIVYHFPVDEGTQSGKDTVRRNLYDQLNPGDSVLVVYRPEKPSHSKLYEAMKFEVETPRMISAVPPWNAKRK